MPIGFRDDFVESWLMISEGGPPVEAGSREKGISQKRKHRITI